MRTLGKVFNNYVLGVLFIALIVAGVFAVYGVFTQKFTHYDKVTLSTDTTGLQLPARADVKIRGVLIGEVTKAVSNGDGRGATLTLGIDPGKLSQIPSNVTASILPKTLFGEKYVELDIPKTGASPAAMRVGGHIAQTKRPIEVQAVLNNLYPLLRTLQPAEINYTLNALSTALRGKGEQLGDTIVTLKDYLARINPQVPALADDLGMLASVSKTYAGVVPELADTLRNTVKTTNTLKSKHAALKRFLTQARSFSDTATGFLDTNGENLVQLGQVTEPQARLLKKYSPEYSCFLNGLVNQIPMLASTFRNFIFHIKLIVPPRQPRGYNIGDKPVVGVNGPPQCLGLPNKLHTDSTKAFGKPVVVNGKTTYPYGYIPNFRDGVDDHGGSLDRGDNQRPATGYSVTTVPSGTARQKAFIAALTAPALGVDADDVPDVTGLLFAPVATGTQVSAR